jgi:alpha-L-fucosidase
MDMETLPHGRAHWKDYKKFQMAEFTYPMLEGQGRTKMRGAQWFYSLPENDNRCVSAEKIYRDYLGAGKFGNIFSLDVGPDRNGRIRKIDEETLNIVGQYIRGEADPGPVYKASASGIWQDDPDYNADKAFDGNLNTRWGSAEKSRSGWIEAELMQPVVIRGIKVSEGDWDRINSFEVQVEVDGKLQSVASGEKIGKSCTVNFKPVKTGRIRFVIKQANEVPTIHEIEILK